MRVLGKARQHLQGFLLRHGRIYAGKKGWTLAYRRWLTTVRFAHPASQIVLQNYIHAVTDAEVRVDRLTKQIERADATMVDDAIRRDRAGHASIRSCPSMKISASSKASSRMKSASWRGPMRRRVA
ncbi:hypothetical protein [Bradyrhizobium sp. Cp5.3]|uniref:hypothetical protein n=1 Tax=Bradyrhizobium sp. Cp5.3 TaxID=443598 RepID=UPI0018DC28E4|nr:hypothetical protein [Bradyrhizobium sp. Cp5.3]